MDMRKILIKRKISMAVFQWVRKKKLVEVLVLRVSWQALIINNQLATTTKAVTRSTFFKPSHGSISKTVRIPVLHMWCSDEAKMKT